jgi:uncharacterized protein YoxC
MNWLGKVFVVLILVLSLLFMGLAMAVYATHRNWLEVSQRLQNQLNQARTENEQLIQAHNRRVEDLTREMEAAEQQVRKLESERVLLAQNNLQIQTELDQLKEERRGATAAVASTQQLNEALTAQANELAQKIRDEQQARDAAFARTLEATEALHQLQGQYETARERMEQLIKQVAGMTHVMKAHGLDPATEPGAVAPTVDGVVSEIRRTPGGQLVEVTIGADDGLKAGNTLEVYRGDRYLGRVTVLHTSPDKAVAQVDRNFQQGAIQEGDRVATRIEL